MDIVDKLREQGKILNANTGGGEYLDEAADRIRELKQLLKGVKDYASHLGNCDLDSWGTDGGQCDCGLFDLLRDIDAAIESEGGE